MTRPGFVDPPDLWNLELLFEGGSSNRETGVGKPQIKNFRIETKSLIDLRAIG